MRGVAHQRDLASCRVVIPPLRHPVADEAGVRRLRLVDGLCDAAPWLDPLARAHAPLNLVDDVFAVATKEWVHRRLLRPEASDHEVPVCRIGFFVCVVDCVSGKKRDPSVNAFIFPGAYVIPEGQGWNLILERNCCTHWDNLYENIPATKNKLPFGW